MADKRTMQFRVLGEDPQRAAAPLFSNFLAVSHLGREVQLEFIFLDIAQVAQHFEDAKTQEPGREPPAFQGKTVAKVVIPSWAFLQLKDHMTGIFQKLELEESGQQEKAGGRAYGV